MFVCWRFFFFGGEACDIQEQNKVCREGKKDVSVLRQFFMN